MRVWGSARESSIEAPAAAFCNTTSPLIEVELRRRCGYYIYVKGKEMTLKGFAVWSSARSNY